MGLRIAGTLPVMAQSPMRRASWSVANLPDLLLVVDEATAPRPARCRFVGNSLVSTMGCRPHRPLRRVRAAVVHVEERHVTAGTSSARRWQVSVCSCASSSVQIGQKFGRLGVSAPILLLSNRLRWGKPARTCAAVQAELPTPGAGRDDQRIDAAPSRPRCARLDLRTDTHAALHRMQRL